MKLKERSDTNLIKQWDIGKKLIYLKIKWLKKMTNILHSLWLALTIGGGKKGKSETIYYKIKKN
jgi:hypothetical protein